MGKELFVGVFAVDVRFVGDVGERALQRGFHIGVGFVQARGVLEESDRADRGDGDEDVGQTVGAAEVVGRVLPAAVRAL